ncbi:excalibur calcium-binding domain-containing protein [Candidatus Omnitrophota bacterium]
MNHIYNCVDFSTHAEAQALFRCCGGLSNDVHRLDRDGDGVACETLP